MKQFLLKTWLMLVCLLVGVGTSWATEVAYKTAKFGTQATSGTSSGYTSTYESVTNGFSVSVANGNTNGTTWDCVKFGRKGNTSVGTITTSNAIDKAITKVVLTIDAITATNVNSIKLYTGSTANACTTEVGTFSSATGDQTVNISSPAANKFYKVSIDCKSGSGNGFVAVSKVVYYYDDAAGGGGDDDSDETITINMDKLTNPNTTSTITYGTYNWTSGTVSGVYNGASSSSNTSFQFNYSSTGSSNYRDKQVLYNTVAVPGKITSIKMITASGSNRSWTPYVSSSAITPANYTSATALTAKTVNSGEGTTWEVTGNNTYFYLNYTTGSASYIGDIVITYTTDDGEDPEPEKTTPTLSFAQATYNATMGDAFVAPTLTNEQNVTVSYASSAEGVATVNASTGEVELVAPGATTITASFAGDEDYNEASASYQLVVAAAPNKYAVTITAPENGTLAVTCDDVDVVSGNTYAVGKNIRIVATPADGYKFRNIQVVDETTHTFTASNEKEWTMGEHEISITANFDVIPTYTINWSVNGAIVKTENLKEGAKVNAPEVADINDKKFINWTTVENYSNATIAPALIDVESTTATDDETYYAVFATQNAGGEKTTLLSEDFAAITTGNSTATGGSGTSWSGNVNFTSTTTAYQAGGAVRLGGGSSTGSITSKTLDLSANSGAFTVEFDAKGWTTVEGQIKVTPTGCSPQTSSITAVMDGDFEHVKMNFTGGQAGSTITFATTAKRAFIDNIVVTTGGGSTYSDYCTTVVTPLHGDGTINFVATTGDGKYYATFSSTRAIKFDEAFINDAETCMASVKAYAVAIVDGQIYRTDQYEVNNDGNNTYIPANTAVLFEYILDEDSETFDGAVPFEYADAEAEYLNAVEDNMLVATPTTGACPSVSGTNYYYKLAYDNYTNKSTLGFWWGAEDGSNSFNVKAGGAVLVVPQSAAANVRRGFSFIEDEVTAIESINNAAAVAGEIFNLQGQRINRLQKGVNIINGKTVIR